MWPTTSTRTCAIGSGVHKVDPTNALILAERLVEMQKALKRIELALRQSHVQTTLSLAS